MIRPVSSLKRGWAVLWRDNPPGAALLFSAGLTALACAVPAFYVLERSLSAGRGRWQGLLDTRIPQLLGNTLTLAAAVTLIASVLGVGLAWLVRKSDLPGRRAWQWLLALPLVIPPYVGAVAYIIILGPRGWAREIFGERVFDIFSFWGVVFVLTMFTYPYVFLICGAALKSINRNFEDVARSQGLGTAEIFWKVNLPFMRPALGAAAILVSLYVLSDFGAVAMLRYSTFTTAIYYRIDGYDNVSAAILSVALLALTLIVLGIEVRARGRRRYHQTSEVFLPPRPVKLGRWKLPALALVLAVFACSLLAPAGVLVYWASLGIARGALAGEFWRFSANSVGVAALAALAAMLLALPVVYLRSRHPSVVSGLIEKLSVSGYALPGVVIALGLIFFFSRYLPMLYGTFALLPAAYVVRFLPQAIQTGGASLNLVSPRMDEVAKSLGCSPGKVMFKVIVPLVTPGLLTGGALVFVSSLKELPATLLLRPPGFDTLSVRIWVEAGEALYHLAAPAALLIIVLSIPPLKWLLARR